MSSSTRDQAGAALPDPSRRALLAVAPAWLLSGAAGAAGAEADTPPLPALQRGLNLTHWFEYQRNRPVGAAEMQMLRSLGFDHVRIPIDPAVAGWSPARGGGLGFQSELDDAVAAALAAGLEVVIDLHWSPEAKARIEADGDAEEAVAGLWQQLAESFAGTPPRQLAFELCNEPQYYGRAAPRWPEVQRRYLQALRAAAPRHLVLLTAAQGSSFEALSRLALLPDRNVAYVFHDYDPFLFTHQGAAWLEERHTTAGLRSGIRYPATAQAGVAPGLAHAHPQAARELAKHLAGGWDAGVIRRRIDRAGDWARANQVRLLCNEFGVIRAHVDPASRYRWIADTRSALEANRIGWTLWDYCDIFGIVEDTPRRIEPAALAALGLDPAAGAR